ncbi:MAG: M1 family metallopeptidase [Flavobacteriaceae bacterium]|jgi:hypothetical protein|nr:M1 family metallopeptidase [Flavobacteriaceae bacterium]NVJ72048.1 M1 family metallopeptidase [Flavobacteriaceae bacterium]
MNIKTLKTFALFLSISTLALAQQSSYWQQKVDYQMDVDFNVKDFTYTGTQQLIYTNNSPDELNKVFIHLYYNAFQPGSEMDIRLQNIADPDRRMITEDKKSRIASLTPEQIGYLHISEVTQDGASVSFVEEGTIAKIILDQPLASGASTTFKLKFSGQIPEQIRRSGRNSKEGVALSMSQWYPKLAEYDYEGWHATPYIAREFHGVWGDFDVKITIDKDYTVGGTGYLQNPQEIGHGYQTPGTQVKTRGKKLTWHFKAPMVHDFMWAADPNYIHDVRQMEDGPTLHFFYKNDEELIENWKKLQPKTEEAMRFFSNNVGKYPYDQYSVVQGGDGGMEYAMSTLITGGRDFGSLVGVMAHEMAHSWFQHILATNETKHSWMDEGFTSFISSLCMNQLMEKNLDNPFEGSYRGYRALVNSGKEQPQTTHSDRYDLNFAYSIAAYSKGSVFLSQLGYIIGQENLMKTIRKYYEDFKFKHPTPNDIKRVAEKVSDMELDWYLTDWTKTTNTIDYGIKSVEENANGTKIVLERKGLMPMPIDLLVVYKDGSSETFYAPLRMMYGQKENPYPTIDRTVLKSWPWAYPTYEITIDRPMNSIKGIQIDPSGLMADIDLENNSYQGEE